jgi:hypothetical protein
MALAALGKRERFYSIIERAASNGNSLWIRFQFSDEIKERFQLRADFRANQLENDLCCDIHSLSLLRDFEFLARWCNWLTRRPLKAESTGSSPVRAILKNVTKNITIKIIT